MCKRLIVWFLCLQIILVCSRAFSETVKVGGYIFPPFVEQTGEQPVGLTLDLIEAMNGFQKEYRFTFISTSSKRRYQDFDSGKYDVIFFESIYWGWEDKKDIEASKVFLKGGEVYITKVGPSKNQSYFDDFQGKTIAAYLGYHYGFANFNADAQTLGKLFNIELSRAHKGNILKVLSDRVDIAVITKSYLDIHLKLYPEHKVQLLVSTKYDQIYQHTTLIRKNAKPSVEEMNALLTEMENTGALAKLWKKYGIVQNER